MRHADIGVPLGTDHVGRRGDLGIRTRGSCAVTGPAPRRRGCACALAFSTLLSSQGADAHRHLAFALIRGNPHNLPADPGRVNQFLLVLTRRGVAVFPPAYPSGRAPVTGLSPAGVCWLVPRAESPTGDPLPAGQDETLGSKAVLVKSIVTAPLRYRAIPAPTWPDAHGGGRAGGRDGRPGAPGGEIRL